MTTIILDIKKAANIKLQTVNIANIKLSRIVLS